MMDFDKDAEKRIMDKLMEQSDYSIDKVVHTLIAPIESIFGDQPATTLLGLIQTKSYDVVEAILK